MIKIIFSELYLIVIIKIITKDIHNMGIHFDNPSLNKGIIKKVKTKQDPKSGCKRIKKTGRKIK